MELFHVAHDHGIYVCISYHIYVSTVISGIRALHWFVVELPVLAVLFPPNIRDHSKLNGRCRTTGHTSLSF